MSNLFDTNINLQQNQIQNIVIDTRTSFPSSPLPGQECYRSDLTKLFYYNGTTWVAGSGVQTITATNTTIAVDNTDPVNPTIGVGTITPNYIQDAGNPHALIALNGSGVGTEYILGANKVVVTDVNGDPAASTTTAAELNYLSGVTSNVQTQINNIQTAERDYKDSVRVATGAGIANLGNIDVTNFDGTAQGVTLIADDRVLVTFPSSLDGIEAVDAKREGIYVVGVITAGFAALTRSTDANTSAQVTNGMTIPNVGKGTFASDAYTLVTPNPIILDTTGLTFAQRSNSGYTGGNGIDITGTTINAKYDNSSIDLNGSNQLEVKNLGITTAKLAASSVTPAKLANYYTQAFLTTDFSAGILTITAATHGLGTIITNIYVIDNSGNQHFGATFDFTTGDVTIPGTPPFNGSVRISV